MNLNGHITSQLLQDTKILYINIWSGPSIETLCDPRVEVFANSCTKTCFLRLKLFSFRQTFLIRLLFWQDNKVKPFFKKEGSLNFL